MEKFTEKTFYLSINKFANTIQPIESCLVKSRLKSKDIFKYTFLFVRLKKNSIFNKVLVMTEDNVQKLYHSL